jgi:hypothetical protein
MSTKYSKLQVFWGVVFVVSLLFIFTGLGTSLITGTGESSGLDRPTVEPEEPGKPQENGVNIGMVLAIVSAVASAGGFIVTTYFAVRDDRREAAMHQLQIDALKKEIEHKDLEIARLRQEQMVEPAPNSEEGDFPSTTPTSSAAESDR